MDERERLERRALAARAGHHRAGRDPAYADAIRGRLSRRTSPSDADLIWLEVYGSGGSAAAVAIRRWLEAPCDVDLDDLERRLAAADARVTARVLLTQHPHSGAFFEWSTPPMS